LVDLVKYETLLPSSFDYITLWKYQVPYLLLDLA
jgi:hypothetical protein